ncbi:MAG TPA: hypothetical protein VK186_27585 [Candidatus Deferrimicrobium sp.]|nr:hypothetical protein [Candidatus Deferrimicrobium sp.]
MKAKIYLSKLHQDLIDGVKDLNTFKGIGDRLAWNLCCDGFCCILDFRKFQNPLDLVSREKKNWMSWYIRKEKSGALLWNPKTNRVFELDDEAFNVLMTLQEGAGLEKAIQEYGVKESDLYSLLAQISETKEAAKQTNP